MRTAVVGASGLVGRLMLELLAQRRWVEGRPVALTTARSAGTTVPFGGGELVCRDLADGFDWSSVDLVLMSAGRTASREHAPAAAAAGCWVVDNSSAWRMDPAVPLVVPEINADRLPSAPGAIVANPNCSTIQVALAVAPLQAAFGLRACHVTTFQAVSGAGAAGQAELAAQMRETAADLVPGRPTPRPATAGAVFPRTIAGNVVPAIGPPEPDGGYEEEGKVVRELRRILDAPGLAVTCTAVRVPSWNGHGAAVRVVCERPVDRAAAVAALRGFPGIVVAEDPHAYATPLEVDGGDAVHVGRVRGEPGRDDVLLLWVVADNLRKGAALNALQIADRLVAREDGRGG